MFIPEHLNTRSQDLEEACMMLASFIGVIQKRGLIKNQYLAQTQCYLYS